MRVVRSISEMQALSEGERLAGRRIAVIPTMGALHRGHTSLIELGHARASTVVTTIFVNPTQFGPKEDLSRYPRPFEQDLKLAAEAGSSIVFAPSNEEMYPKGFQTVVENTIASGSFEGAVRPGHFRGVVTIVAKLLLITKPHVAVFGQKDAQQVAVVRSLIRDLNIDVEMVVAPIIREPDGLALSSRNAYLSPDERSRSVVLSRALAEARRLAEAGERTVHRLRDAMVRIIEFGRPTGIDYVAIVDPDTFAERSDDSGAGDLAIVAVRFGATRLLDNTFLSGTEHRA